MYGLFGGCTTLLHLFVRQPILVLALGLSGLASQVPTGNPGLGDRFGTADSLARLEHQIVKENPQIAAQTAALRARFDSLGLSPSDEQIGQVLNLTDACTDIRVQDLNPDERREAGWLLYLDTVSRRGAKAADSLFAPPPKKE